MLRLTKRGTRANAVRHGTVEAAIAAALDGVSERDRTATRRVLERLAVHLEPAGAPRIAAAVARMVADPGRKE